MSNNFESSCCHQEDKVVKCNNSIYNGIVSTIIPKTGNIDFNFNFRSGCDINQLTDTLLRLNKNTVYMISYNLNSKLTKKGYLSIKTRIDGINKEYLTACATNEDSISPEICVTNNFLINISDCDVYLDFLACSSEKFISLLGSISIMEIC